MLKWAARDMAAATATAGIDWLIVLFHHPPYSRGFHNSDKESFLIEMRQNALPIIEAAGADVVYAGHSHSYERSFLIDGAYGSSKQFQACHSMVGKWARW